MSTASKMFDLNIITIRYNFTGFVWITSFEILRLFLGLLSRTFIENFPTIRLLTQTFSSFGKLVTTTLGYPGISVDTLERQDYWMDRWYDNIDEKQHYELKNASGFPLLLIQNFKQGIYTVGIVVYHYKSSF